MLPAPPQIPQVRYDTSAPLMEREQIEMLLAEDDDAAQFRSLALELLTLFKTDAQEKLATLDAVCRARDQAALRRQVHFIAGSAGNLGMMRLCAFCRGIEQAIDDGVLEDFAACAREIPAEFDLSCQCFARTFDLD